MATSRLCSIAALVGLKKIFHYKSILDATVQTNATISNADEVSEEKLIHRKHKQVQGKRKTTHIDEILRLNTTHLLRILISVT